MSHLVALSLLLLTAAPSYQAATVTVAPPSATAARFLDLFDRLHTAEQKSQETGRHHLVTFLFSEADVNDYLRYSLKTTPRPGLESLTVKASSKDYVATQARVDFDALERWRPGTIPAALKTVLKGKKTISIDFHIQADNSVLTFTVEKARFEDVPLPAIFVEKVIQLVAARQPEKYDTSHPLPLPFGLRKIWTSEQTFQGHN
jgi:hypothetical protein